MYTRGSFIYTTTPKYRTIYHPSPTFYRGRGQKVRNLTSTFDHSSILSRPHFETKPHIGTEVSHVVQRWWSAILVKFCSLIHTLQGVDPGSSLPLVSFPRVRSKKVKTRKRAIAKTLQLKGHSDYAPVDLAYYQHFLFFFLENIAFWEVPHGNHKCRSRGATPLVNNKLESVQLQKHCISNDIAPDVLGFSGLFGLKILFSDVLRSAPGNRHVEPIHPLCTMRMRVVGGCSTHWRGK